MAPPPEYQVLIQQALTEYDHHDLAEARALFNRANELYPNARTQRGLGMVEFELRNYGESIAHLEAALVSQVKPLAGTLRADTETLLSRARSFVGHYELEWKPQAQTPLITVDDVAVELDASHSLALTVGEHVIVVQALGCKDEKRALSVKGGEQVRLVIAFRPVLAPEPTQLMPMANAAPVRTTPARAPALATEAAPEARNSSLFTSPWLWTGVGAVVVAAGGVVAGILLLRKPSLVDIPPGNAGAVRFALTGAR